MRTGHRLQSSVEFLTLLAAVAVFCVAVIAIYLHFNSSQTEIYNGITRLAESGLSWVPSNTVQAAQLMVYASVPNLTRVNASVPIYVIVGDSGTFIKVNASVEGYGGVSVYPGYINTTVNGFGVLGFVAVPGYPGEKEVVIRVHASAGNVSLSRNITAHMFAARESGTANQTYTNSTSFSGTVSQAGERINYYASKQSRIQNVTYWSHCAYHGFFGGVEPEEAQCGPNTWGFDTGDSSCNPFAYNGDDRFYCFANSSDNANASSIGQQSGYDFNATLRLQNSSLSLQASFTNNATDSKLIGKNGEVYGNAVVTGVYGPDVYPVPYLAYAVLEGPRGTYPINISGYSAYSSLDGQVVQLLGVYNTSGGADLGYIEGLISELNSKAAYLIASPQSNSSECSLVKQAGSSYLSCSTQDLAYNILVSMNSSRYPNINQTLYLGSSVVEVI